MKLQTSGVLGTSYAIAKLAPKRVTIIRPGFNSKTYYNDMQTMNFWSIPY